MRSRIIRVGSSFGVQIPARLLRRAGLFGEVELEVKDGRLVVAPTSGVRVGWEAAFAEMARHEEDQLIEFGPREFDANEWEW